MRYHYAKPPTAAAFSAAAAAYTFSATSTD